jgi:hypothetical protein
MSRNLFAKTIKMLFGFVAAGEVHPQPHILMFGKGNKSDFTW